MTTYAKATNSTGKKPLNQPHTIMTLNKQEQNALNAWLTVRQDIVENKPINLKLIERKDKLLSKLKPNSVVFTHIKLIQNTQ